MAKNAEDDTVIPPEDDTVISAPRHRLSEEYKKESLKKFREQCVEAFKVVEKKLREMETPEAIAKALKNDRRLNAVGFRGEYEYVSENSKETKTCIWSPHGVHNSWEEKYSGVTWIGIHGTNSICVVTLAEELDMTRVSGGAAQARKHDIMGGFRRTAIYEVEVLPNPPGKTFKKTFKDWMKSVEKPFGVVCVSGDSDKGYNEQKAVEFLKNEFTKNAGQSTLNFGTDKTVTTALGALQVLCNKVFKRANEIEISLLDPNYSYSITANEPFKDYTIEELTIQRIRRYLVAINEPEFKGKEPNMDEVEIWFIMKAAKEA